MSSHTSLEQDGSDLTKKKLRHLEHTLLSEGEASLPFEEEEVSLPLEEEDKPPPTQPGHPQLRGFPPAGHSVTLALSGSIFYFFFLEGEAFSSTSPRQAKLCA